MPFICEKRPFRLKKYTYMNNCSIINIRMERKMNINLKKKINKELNDDEINILIEHSANTNIDKVIEHIKNYENQNVLVRQNNEYIEIDFHDIIVFYSDKRDIYCRTKIGKYKIKNSLTALENLTNDFVRISKSCIINIKHLESFDMGETGIIVVKLDDGTEEVVSRRKVKEILRYIKERSI